MFDPLDDDDLIVFGKSDGPLLLALILVGFAGLALAGYAIYALIWGCA